MQTALSKRAKIAWSILKRAQFYPQGQKSCDLLQKGHKLYVGFLSRRAKIIPFLKKGAHFMRRILSKRQKLYGVLKKGHILCAIFYRKGQKLCGVSFIKGTMFARDFILKGKNHAIFRKKGTINA